MCEETTMAHGPTAPWVRAERVSPAREMFQVWDAGHPAQHAEWLAFWRDSPEREVFLHPGYVSAYAEPGRSRALCAAWQSPSAKVMFAFLLRDLTVEPYFDPRLGAIFDTISPTGYGGPAAWGEAGFGREPVLREFWSRFGTWARQTRVVSSFVRFSLDPDTRLSYPGELVRKQDNVIRRLDVDEHTLWREFPHNLRKKISASRRHGIVIEHDPNGARLDAFHRIHRHTMERRSAHSSYHLSVEFFRNLIRAIPDQTHFFHALREGRVVSTEMVLLSEHAAYSFQGGTDESSFHWKPNQLLKHEIMLWAKRLGKSSLVLGGSPDRCDGVLAYKRSFAPDGLLPYYVGQRIFFPDVYDKLLAARRAIEAPGWSPRPEFFPAYRA